jgi:hypothetical protein
MGKESDITEYVEEEYGQFKVDQVGKDADITVEFINDISADSQSIRVRPPVACDEKGVFFHDHNYRVLRVDIEKVGIANFRVTCDVGFNKHFFVVIMEYLIHHLILESGHYFCHASAFIYEGKVILCPAWRHVGKTNILLAFMNEGAQYLGDDWVIVNQEGLIMSMPKRLNLLFYNFREYPELCNHLDEDFKLLFNFVNRAEAGLYELDDSTLGMLTEKARLRISPFEIFKQEYNGKAVEIDYVFLLRRKMHSKPNVNEISLGDLAIATTSIIEFEQSHFHLYYLAYKAHNCSDNKYLEKYQANLSGLIEKSFSSIHNLYEITITSQNESLVVKEFIEKTIGCK